MLLSGALKQEGIDVKPYKVDGVLKAAYYPSDHYKHRYYCVMDYGCAVELKIKKNKVEPRLPPCSDEEKPNVLVGFKYYDKIVRDKEGEVKK